ncbi:MAG: type III pantothenate kinase, partial [Oscillospiraceae bacterium]|nr:type III pantothenate kinase [Oscillospiraceae bacterium]
MLLAIDIGNTTVCFTGLERTGDGEWQINFSRKRDTDAALTAPQWRAVLDGLPEINFQGAVLSSVVPAVTGPLAAAVESLLGRPPVLVTAGSDTGLTLAVPHPERVGADRLADAAWAAAHCPLPAVTVDLGTATTVNVIDRGGVFLGGAIALGVESSLRALGGQAAQLPRLEVSASAGPIGQTTQECMLVGAVAGTAAMIDGLVANIEERLGPVTLLLTGGLVPWVGRVWRGAHLGGARGHATGRARRNA